MKIKTIIMTVCISFLCMGNISTQAASADKTIIRPSDNMKKLFDMVIKEGSEDRIKPLSEEDAYNFKKAQDDFEKMIHSDYKDLNIKNRSVSISFENGQGNESFYTAPGYTTTVIFLDKAGNHWPIEKFIVGNDEAYSVQIIHPSTLVITPKKTYKKTNLTVMFQGIAVPAIFTLESSRQIVDYKVEGMLPGFEPSAQPAKRVGGMRGSVVGETNPYAKFKEVDVANMLSGDIPSNLVKKTAFGHHDIQVYERGETYYILTNNTELMYPEPIDSRVGAMGNKLYITTALPNLLVLSGGELIKVRID